MSIILFIIIGKALEMNGWYYFGLGLYAAAKIIIWASRVISLTNNLEENQENA